MANIIRRRPVNNLLGLRDEMDRFLSDTFRLFDDDYGARLGWQPAVDLEETEDAFMVTAELPGMKKDDIKINIAENKVMISGELLEEQDVQEKNYYVKERARGRFSRGFTLPAPVSSANAEATYKEGILKLKLPKAEEAKPKEIAIKDE